jgi:hypothetical protein
LEARRSSALLPQEFRFLRKHFRLSQTAFGDSIGADTQTVARFFSVLTVNGTPRAKRTFWKSSNA